MNRRHHDNKQYSRHAYVGSTVLAVTLTALTALPGMGSFNLIPTSAWADQTGTAQTDSSNGGQITAVGSASLEVEGKSYRLDPKIEIRTEGGQSMELAQLQVGMGVRLQLKEGAISKVMVMNPR
jgi:hypothetical protein